MNRLRAVALPFAAVALIAGIAAADVIKEGTPIHPPKRADFVADMNAEKAWFAELETTQVAKLQPGDILLRKEFDEKSAVVQAQRGFVTAPKGSRFTVHAMLYLGDGNVGHASHDFGGVVVTPIARIHPLHALVYRPADRAAADSAVATMRWLTTEHLKYSVEHCLMTGPHSSSWGPLAKHRATEVAERKLPVEDHQMMCSEAVSFSFQGRKGHPDIEVDAHRTAPIRLENYLNEHSKQFVFAGALRQD